MSFIEGSSINFGLKPLNGFSQFIRHFWGSLVLALGEVSPLEAKDSPNFCFPLRMGKHTTFDFTAKWVSMRMQHDAILGAHTSLGGARSYAPSCLNICGHNFTLVSLHFVILQCNLEQLCLAINTTKQTTINSFHLAGTHDL